MKKSILLILPFALGLAACSGGSNLDKGSVITPKFMEQNFGNSTMPEASTKYEIEKFTDVGNYSFSGYLTQEHLDWVGLTDKETNTVGVYSLGARKFVMPTTAKYTAMRYAKVLDSYFFMYKTTDDEGKVDTWHVVDELCNEVFVQDTAAGETVKLFGEEIDEKLRVGDETFYVVFAGNDFDYQVATYNYDFTIGRKGTYLDFLMEEGATYDNFLGYMDDYGHPELAMGMSNTDSGGVRVSFYNLKESKFVSSFDFPVTESIYLAGDYMVYQQAYELEERATDYDVFVDGTKYNIETTKLNYLTGAKQSIDTKILFTGAASKASVAVSSTYPLFDENGVIKYAYSSSVMVIREDKTLDQSVYGYILDENVNVVADVTGIDFMKLVKYGDYYFDPTNYMIYDGKLNEVAYVPAATVTSEGIIFTQTFGGRPLFGLMSYDGKVIIRPIYEYMEETVEGVYNYGTMQKEYVSKVENGKVTVLREISYDTLSFAGYYDSFYTICVYENAEGEYVYYNMTDGSEFTPFELADGDSYLGYYGTTTTLGGTMMNDTYFITRANGNLALLQDSSWLEYKVETK